VTEEGILTLKQKNSHRSSGWDAPENGQGHVLLPGAVLAHADAKARAEEQLSGGHQVALLRGLELQHRGVPDESMQLAVEGRGMGGGEGGRLRRNNSTMIYIPIYSPRPFLSRSLALTHQIVCVIQRLPAISTAAYGEGAAPPLDSPQLKDVRLGTT